MKVFALAAILVGIHSRLVASMAIEEVNDVTEAPELRTGEFVEFKAIFLTKRQCRATTKQLQVQSIGWLILCIYYTAVKSRS